MTQPEKPSRPSMSVGNFIGLLIAIPALLIVLGPSALLLVGLAQGERDQRRQEEEAVAQEQAIIDARPPYQEVAAEYQAMLSEMRDAIEEHAPELRWDQDGFREIEQAKCPYPADEIENTLIGTFSLGRAEGAVPEKLWPELRSELVEVAARHGVSDRPDNWSKPSDGFSIRDDETGASVTLRTRGNTTLEATTPCLIGQRLQPKAESDQDPPRRMSP
ncbi:LppA family lipoprotein [Kineosporia babensis]|uniref:LppA family lipoprotein n=1 Tax=Kineosporia babensis TaxID=499548 RepID=A0A9X1NEV6_9ACTN|nr:LppA family lipoprotein [Kineosporia babensis]MCD5311793.1 LppA family lipoprotein [Kineosporia babensis]